MARLGFPVRPKVKRMKIEPGSKYDISAAVEASRRARKVRAAEVVKEMYKKYIGEFDTRLPCNCGKANITDRATTYDPNARPQDLSSILIGPGPYQPPEAPVTDFRVFHSYWCKKCGAAYEASVIETTRKYVPREQRPAALRWRDKKLAEIMAC